MSARKKAPPTPSEQVAEISAQRMALAVERATARSEMERAYDALGVAEPLGPNAAGRPMVRPLPEGQLSIAERLQTAGELRRIGQDHEPIEPIKAEAAELWQVIKDNGPAIVELDGSMKRLADEIEALEARHRDYFVKLAEEGSRAAEAQVDKLLEAFDETTQALNDMWGRWGRVSIGVSTRDLSHIRRELQEARRECFWPGRSEENWRARKAAEQAPAGARLSNRDSQGPAAEPLLESIG